MSLGEYVGKNAWTLRDKRQQVTQLGGLRRPNDGIIFRRDWNSVITRLSMGGVEHQTREENR